MVEQPLDQGLGLRMHTSAWIVTEKCLLCGEKEDQKEKDIQKVKCRFTIFRAQ
jgi:putative component of toxin-antitoxin plasmid stabilization module